MLFSEALFAATSGSVGFRLDDGAVQVCYVSPECLRGVLLLWMFV